MTTEQRAGLRERKKARTRAAIQDAALRLYLRKGYAATTIQEIADAADVSESTFFRYFPTKPETVLYDRLDPVFIESFINQPAELSPVAAFRAAMHNVFDALGSEERELEHMRWRLIFDVQELRAPLMARMDSDSRMFAEAVATRVGRRPDDFAVLTFTGALIGAVIAAFFDATGQPGDDPKPFVDRVLTQFEAGFPL